MARRKKTNITFYKYYVEWVETYKEGAIRDVTLQKYYMAADHIKRYDPDLKLQDIDRREYQKIINWYALTHEKQTTIDFHHQIKAALRDAVHDGLLEHDPTYRAVMKGKEPSQKLRKFLSQAELGKLIRVLDCGQEINRDWFTLIVIKTGLRFAEALALTPVDFDLKAQTLTVNKTLNYKSTKMQFAPTKNESSNRVIAIDWQIVGQFGPLIANLPPEEPIFVDLNKRIFNSTYNLWLKQKCIKAEIDVVTMHSLRHTHASVLLAAGVSLHTISDRLGHSNVTTTQETYLHIIDELAEKDNAKMIGALMQLA